MITYIVKSSLSLIILFGLYWFLLRKEKMFEFNRFFLVLSVVFSLVVPFISIPVNLQTSHKIENYIPSYEYLIPEIRSADNIISDKENISQQIIGKKSSPINSSAILITLYIAGAILFLFRFLRNIYIIMRRTESSEKIRFNGYRIVLTNDKKDPCCFLSRIYLNRDDYRNGRIDNELIYHELEHVKQSHTIDILFIEFVKIFYWFNPVHILYDRAIRLNHEYLADNGVISENNDIKSYTEKLLGFIAGRSNMTLTSGLNHSLTKKRLLMMTKTKSKRSVYGLRITITLGLILVISLFLSFKQSTLQLSGEEANSGGLTDFQTKTVKDIDGNIYKTVTIGYNIWMAENLKTTRYNDETDIPLVSDNKGWQEYEPAFSWYNNNGSENKNKYGALYNWYAVNTNKLCPVGWHVPDRQELKSLIKWDPKDTITGGTLKETGTAHWRIPNKGATNETGFTALPGGFRAMDGEFTYLGECCRWWTANEENAYIGLGVTLSYNDSRVGPAWVSKRVGFSVRCIKDYLKETSNSSINSGEIIQNIVRGIVLNEEGKPLKEAIIICMISKNASSGMTVGPDGRFAINNVQPDNSLRIGCFGYLTQIIKPDFTSEMIIKLKKNPKSPEIKDVYFRNPDFTQASALVAINGVILDYEGALKVNPGEIESYKILKDKEATVKYGDKGKDGVLEIVLYGNQPGSTGNKRANEADSDTSKYISLLSINRVSNKGELIDIPVSNLQSASMWTYHDTPTKNKKELRTIGIITRDFYKVKGSVVNNNGKPLSGVLVSVSDNPVKEISDKDGRFVIKDVRENVMLEFSLPGYKPYYLATSGAVFTMEMKIELEKDNSPTTTEL